MAEASPFNLPLHSARDGLLHARKDELRQDQHTDGKPSRGDERQQPGQTVPSDKLPDETHHEDEDAGKDPELRSHKPPAAAVLSEGEGRRKLES
jgi:hypothetical protein